MKKQFLKSALCLSLSAAVIFSGAGSALAQTAAAGQPDAGPVEVTGLQADVSGIAEEGTQEAEGEAAVAEETEASQTDSEPGDAAAGITADASAEENTADVQEDIDSLGAKIVAPYNLAAITGLAYDPATGIVSWDKVVGATSYRIEIDDAAGNNIYSSTTDRLYVRLDKEDFSENAGYLLKITAKNYTEMYLVADNVAYSDRNNFQYDSSVAKTVGDATVYALYKYPCTEAPAQISTIIRFATSQIVSSLAAITFKEITGSYAEFSVTPSAIQSGEYVQYDYANNEGFKSDGAELVSSYGSLYESAGVIGTIRVPLSDFTSGDTIYIRARVCNPNYDYSAVPGQTYENRYSQYVKLTYQIPSAAMRDVSVVVTENSIRLKPSCDGSVTGFQYQRKNGKKWTDLAQQSDNYTDKGLKGDTKYTYRVRAYVYNKKANKTFYTGWKTVSAYTWGSALNLKGSAASASSVSLKWSKVAKAEGYEIYRTDTSSGTYNIEKGDGEEAFQNATLVKTMKKPKKAAFKDNKLSKGMTYTYIVRAYRTVNKNKYYIQESISVPLTETEGLEVLNSYYTAKGTYVVNWKKMTGISGYKVEKRDPRTNQYVPYKTLGKSKASITLPNVAAGAAAVEYRIRPYKGSRYYDGWTVSVRAMLPAVKNVKATKTAEGVKVTWSAVSGAEYYQVYRAKKDSATYNKTTKTYSLGEGAELVYESNYTDTSAGLSLAPASGGPLGYYYSSAVWNAVADGKFYERISSYETASIKGTSVVDKTVKVKALVPKSEDPAYNSAADPDKGDFKEYQKNADGSLKTKEVVMVEGPQAGSEYFYFVRAVAKPANGANANSDYTYSVGYTKSAHVVYTGKAAVKKASSFSVSSKKKANVTVKIKKVKGVKGYAIYRSTKQAKGYVKVGATTKTTYTDTNVAGGKTYYYKVAAYKQTENGTFMYSKMSKAKKVKVKK